MNILKIVRNEVPKQRRMAIFDVDNTLFGTNECLRLAGTEVYGPSFIIEDYDTLNRSEQLTVLTLAYTKYMDFAVPKQRVIDELKRKRGQGYKIVILTARALSIEAATATLLKKHGIEYDEIYHNPDGEGTHGIDFKVKKIAELVNGFESVEVYEDRRSYIDKFVEASGKDLGIYWVSPEGAMLKV